MKKIILLLLFILSLTGCVKINFYDDSDVPNEDEVEENKTPVSYYGSDNDVYRINIKTENNDFLKHVGSVVPASLNITEQDITKVLISDVDLEINVRGNSTSAAPKKPFKIKFSKAQSLFGLESAKEWVLLANYFDKTNVRNYLAYNLANKLSNLHFQPSSIFVDVYLNDEYQGLYMLTEQMEVNKGRIDIENAFNSQGIGSIFLEADIRAFDEYPNLQDKCYFIINNYALKFKYPSCNKYLNALNDGNIYFVENYERNIKWTINFFNTASNALIINDYEEFSKYFDIPSFIDYYFVQEFFKNVDVGTTSQFYYIKQSETPKISCGPVWDFDISSGVVGTSTYESYCNTELWVKYIDSFYQYLFKNKTFVSMVKSRYLEIRNSILSVFDDLNEIKEKLEKSQSRNLHKWPLPKFEDCTSWIELYAISKDYFEIETLEGHYNYLYNYLKERLLLLDDTYM